jgi:hypothetical protein
MSNGILHLHQNAKQQIAVRQNVTALGETTLCQMAQI